jgi:hypothetical protein
MISSYLKWMNDLWKWPSLINSLSLPNINIKGYHELFTDGM